MLPSFFRPETAAFFESAIGAPTVVQMEAWPAIHRGDNVLVSAPTGTGKTLAAFLVLLDTLCQRAQARDLPDQLCVLYLSPLKALGNDIRENLRRPLEGLRAPLRVAVRTGDTPQSERQQMLRKPPHILITTPESLFLLLTGKQGQRMLSTVETVIIDELHAVIDTKRGAHMQLSLSRLDALCGRAVQRIALSATIRPLERAAQFLAERVTVIAPAMHKRALMAVESPLEDMRSLPDGTIWPAIARAVVAQCEKAHTVIAFVEGRAQAEKLAYGVNEIMGAGYARTHHGCVSKEQRLEAEQQLRSGALKLLCATSSMELGIDVGDVDLVLQIGNPGTVSSALQRMGRAGHAPARESVMHLFPRTAAECVACGLTAAAAMSGVMEETKPPQNCLDLVAQHLVSMAATRGYAVSEAWEIIRHAPSFQGVTREDMERVLTMLYGDDQHAQDHPVRPRILYDRVHDTFTGDAYSRMLACSSGGTIPDRGWYPVMLEDGTRLGELDEEYVFEARVGDKFLLGAFAWRIASIQRDRVMVTRATPEGAQSPFWKGDGRGRAFEMGLKFGGLMRALEEAAHSERLIPALRGMHLDAAAAENAARHIRRQMDITGCLPTDRTLIMEHFMDEAGEHQLMLHSVLGRRVNFALELLLQYEAQRSLGVDVRAFSDDDGVLLYVMGAKPIPDDLLLRLKSEEVASRIGAMLSATPLFSMRFRYNSARALMMGVRKGGRQPLWVQRLRGAEALSLAAQDASHPLMRESLRECLEDDLDIPALLRVLRGIRLGEIAVKEIHTDAPSPMALPLRRQVETVMMYEYAPIPMAAQDAARQALEAQCAIAPAPEQVEWAMMRTKQPRDREQLHALLMMEGDIVAGEVDAPIVWLEELSQAGRALYIEPGLWICREQAALYQDALEEGETQALMAVARRCLRYRGAHTAAMLSERYCLALAQAENVLDALVQKAQAVLFEGAYVHHQLYQRAQRATLAARRNAVGTLSAEYYAACLARSVREAGSPAQQLEAGLKKLMGQPFAPEMWERVLLPARTSGYRPAMLDALLARGEIVWRMEGAQKPQVRFDRYDAQDFEAERVPGEMTELESALYQALLRRGASFAHALAPLLKGASALDGLTALARMGAVHADTFAPVRQMMSATKKQDVKRRARARVTAQDAGRWELTRPLLAQTREALLRDAFDRHVLICKETFGAFPWSEALNILRVWEYTGLVRRGYFIQGLSGAQFLWADTYDRVYHRLSHPDEEILWLHANDPAQAWGRVLPHREGRAFLCVAGTAVALRGGLPVMVLERQGEVLRAFDEADSEAALCAFARDFALSRIFAGVEKVLVRHYPSTVRDALVHTGFSQEMQDFVLWRSVR